MQEDGDDSDEILLEDEIQDKVFVKLKKFVKEKFQNIKQEYIEDFLYSQDTSTYIRQDSYTQDNTLEFESTSNQKSGNKRTGAGSGIVDMVSEQDSEGNSSPEAAQDNEQKPPAAHEAFPSRATLLAVMNQGEDVRASLSTSSTGRRQSSAG